MFSSLNALTLSPALCSLLLQSGEQNEAAWYRRFQQGFGRLTGFYDGGVQWVLRSLRIVVVIFVAWMAALVFGFMNTPTGFVPDEDKGVMLVNMQLPDASSISRSKAAMDKLAGLIAADPAVETVTAITGLLGTQRRHGQ